MDIIDLLFIGGPKWVINKTGLVIRQCDFTFEGIGEAYRKIPACKGVVVVPDNTVFDNMPSADDFDNINPFRSYSGLDTSLVPLGLYDPVHDEISAYAQVKANLVKLPGEKTVEFVKKAAHVFIERLLERLAVLVGSGFEVRLLFPEDFAAPALRDCGGGRSAYQSNKLQCLIKKCLPGIQVYEQNEWSAITQGDYKFLVENFPSKLGFQIDADVFGSDICLDFKHGTFPDTLNAVSFLQSEVTVEWEAGAFDRADHWRVLILKWGTGKMALGPSSCLHILQTDKIAMEHFLMSMLPQQNASEFLQSPVSKKQQDELPESERSDKMSDDGTPPVADVGPFAKMLPRDEEELTEWNNICNFTSSAIQSVQEIAYTLDALYHEGHKNTDFKRSRVGMYNEEQLTVYNGKGAVERKSSKTQTIDKIKIRRGALRTLIHNKIIKAQTHKNKDLKGFLEAAKEYSKNNISQSDKANT